MGFKAIRESFGTRDLERGDVLYQGDAQILNLG
jgi:hypothetical protein